VEDIPHLCRIDGVFDMWEDLVGASHLDNGSGVVSSFSPVSQFGTALPGIAFWLRLFSSHDLVIVCSHDYSPNFLFPPGLVVFGQLRDVAVSDLESFGSHSAGGWSVRRSCKSTEFGGLGVSGRTVISGVLVRAGGRRFRGSWRGWEDGVFAVFGGHCKGGRTVYSRFSEVFVIDEVCGRS